MRFLYQNVDVLFIGKTAAPTAGEKEAPENPGSGLITFAVPPEAAERIAFAASQQDTGGLWLTLVPPSNQVTRVDPVGPDNVFEGDLTPTP
jgi:hypothetical protein